MASRRTDPAAVEAAQRLGQHVANTRLKLGMSMTEAASTGGISRKAWWEVETGRSVNVQDTTLDAIERTLGISPGALRAMSAQSDDTRIERLRREMMAMLATLSPPFHPDRLPAAEVQDR